MQKYDVLTNGDTKILVSQKMITEHCAVARYQQICEMCRGIETFRVLEKSQGRNRI